MSDAPNPAEQYPLPLEPGAAEADSFLPTEPFDCPHCGQMLGPTARVCPVCKRPIDLARTTPPPAAPVEGTPGPQVAPVTPLRALFSWQTYLVVLLLWLFLSVLAVRLLGGEKAQMLAFGFVIGSSIWVLYDARSRAIPRPLRWALGSLLLWIVVFPLYLSRRRMPAARGLGIEAQFRPWVRALLFALVLLFVLSLVMTLIKGPLPH